MLMPTNTKQQKATEFNGNIILINTYSFNILGI